MKRIYFPNIMGAEPEAFRHQLLSVGWERNSGGFYSKKNSMSMIYLRSELPQEIDCAKSRFDLTGIETYERSG
jgi:hypothetical protein